MLSLVAATATLAATMLAGLAAAEPTRDPGELADTPYTPQAKETAKDFGWKQLGGAVFDSEEAKAQADAMGYEDRGEIPHTVDFYTVSFVTPDRGFAAGAACENEDDPIATCLRVPVIYRYESPAPGLPAEWREVYRSSGQRGFVGALAWIDARKAVAVGGSGCYPRREGTEGCANGQAASAPSQGRLEERKDKIAGEARAWVFQNGEWHALANLPTRMTGLTALDFSPRVTDCRAVAECGWAGGLGQIWTWKDGRFSATPSYQSVWRHCPAAPAEPVSTDPCAVPVSDPGVSPAAPNPSFDSPFRVRQIKVKPGSAAGIEKAAAVTSGCCFARAGVRDPSVNFPRVMKFLSASQSWRPAPLMALSPGVGNLNNPAPRTATLPDSLYALTWGTSVNGNSNCLGVVATPGGPAEGGTEDPATVHQPASRVLGPVCDGITGGGLLLDGTLGNLGQAGSELISRYPELSSVRLLAGDGDLESHSRNIVQKIGVLDEPSGGRLDTTRPDGHMDWAVGTLGPDGRAAAYTTTRKTYGADVPYPLSCPDESVLPTQGAPSISAQCQADAAAADQLASSHLMMLPSYSLNAFTTVGKTGTSWAAGDRGALLKLSGEGVTAATGGADNPPKLGSGQATRLSDRASYDAFRPLLSAEPGLVPPLTARPLVDVPAGKLVPFGSPDAHPHIAANVRTIVMSRDGSEGWALGPTSNQNANTHQGTPIHHFDGSRWVRCDPVGLAGIIPPDSACASLADLVQYKEVGVKFVALARVPLEHGSDASKANDFEVVAIARHPDEPAGPKHAVVRYRNGEWTVDRDWSEQLSLSGVQVEMAFATPDDGWILVPPIGTTPPRLYRLKKNRWENCDSEAKLTTTCLDSDPAGPILPHTLDDGAPRSAGSTGLRLTSVGTRVYMYGSRRPADAVDGIATPLSANRFPVILYVDARDGENQSWQREYDPMHGFGCGAQDCTNHRGVLNALSVIPGPDDELTGWGVGDFGLQGSSGSAARVNNADATPLIRRDPDTGRWAQVSDPGPAAMEYLLPPTVNEALNNNVFNTEVVALRGRDGAESAVAIRGTGTGAPDRPMVWLNPESGRWEPFATPFSMSAGSSEQFQHGNVTALAPDGRGGVWLTGKPRPGNGSWFYRFSWQLNEPVFSDVPHPVRETLTAAAPGGDGSFWVATESGTVYRYDRLTGWDRVALKGWDNGGVVQSPAYGIAVGEDGEGVVVGKAGRIAAIGPRSVSLDPAAVMCSANRDNCATTKTLRSVAVASDGSALAGGDNRALVWRPAGGTFRAVSPPDISRSATITAVSMPAPTRAWLTTTSGDVLVGKLTGGDWQWVRENVGADGLSLARDRFNQPHALHGVAIDENGHGFAVGDRGVILERTGDQARPWKRLSGYTEDMRSVVLGPGGKGALIGGEGGIVLTLSNTGRFEVARPGDFFDPATTARDMGSVVGLALLPGAGAGDVEAWAVAQAPFVGSARNPPPGAILHYASDPSDPQLAAGAGRAKPLPDAPEHQPGELELAAFGKSDCQLPPSDVCPPLGGTMLAHEQIVRGILDALTSDGGQPDLAVFTGDASDVGGSRNRDLVSLPTEVSSIHQRWNELVAGPFARAGVPLYGALGGQDVSYSQACDPINRAICTPTRFLRTGLNLAWRKAMADAPAPWGRGKPRSARGLTFKEVDSIGVNTDATLLAGARTHYAVDVRREGKKVLRLVVLDTSLKTVAGTAPLQNPVREQLAWLDDVLSERTGRQPGQPAVVVSETPSYAYSNSAGAATDTLADAAAFETVLVKNRVTAVISGRLGWNGLYWLVAPGLHTPCPGGSYQPDPPRDASELCQAGGNPVAAADDLAGNLEHSLSAPVPRPSKVAQDVAGQLANIPVAVAASAGGKFGPIGTANGSGSQGFWRGYTRVRVFPGKDLTPVVEQRPVFDWIGLHAVEHTLLPGRRLRLQGYGREPLSIDRPARYVDIDGPAITHRYDLVLADPARPYLPKVDPTSENPHGYVPVPDEIGATVDRQTGVVRYSGRGNHPPVYALAILSVGDKAATWPLVLAPRRSFKAQPPRPPARIVLPPPPTVRGTTPAAIPPTPPTQIPKPPNLNLTFPPPPSLPSLSLNAPQTQPPAPPPPPPPPVSPAASALQITPAPVGLNVAPAATVIPPPAPPIQPAPPSGARREARQRQAAVAKSEEGGGDEGARQESGGGGGESNSASTRLDQRRDLAFTAHEVREQPSAWSRSLLYGGGIGVAALTLALGWSLIRPGPRRRQTELPAPAWARNHRRRD